jgi:methylmalonic aciduria homocystinuria type C protein
MFEAAAADGFDLAQSFAVCWYNDAVAPEQRLPDFGRARALGVLIGNSRALWLPFLAAWRADTALRAASDPLDRYTETRLSPPVERLGVRAAVRWAHEPPPRIVMQRLAHLSGLAPLAPMGLNIHPVYGPWIALRAVIVLDAEGPPGGPPAVALPCDACAQACAPAFARARAAPPDDWRAWLAARDACPLGRAHRYDDAQIAYHYTKDRGRIRIPSP